MKGALVAIAIVAAFVTVAGVAVVFSGDEDGPGADFAGDVGFGSETTPEPGSPEPAPRVQRYQVGGRPDAISAGAGYIWVTDSQRGSLRRINPGSKRPITVEVGGFPTDVSADGDAAWLALADRGAVQRLSGTEGADNPVEVAGFPFRIATGAGSIWAMSQTSVERIDPATLEAGEPVELDGDLASIAAGEGAVWVVRDDDRVLRLDAGSGRESGGAVVPGAINVTVGEAAVWVLGGDAGDGSGETVVRMDPSGSVAGSVHVVDAVDVAAGLGFVWVLDARGRVRRFEPNSGRPAGRPIRVGRDPAAITVGEGAAWVAALGDGAVYRVSP